MPSPLVQALQKISYWMENSNSEHAQRIRERFELIKSLSNVYDKYGVETQWNAIWR